MLIIIKYTTNMFVSLKLYLSMLTAFIVYQKECLK